MRRWTLAIAGIGLLAVAGAVVVRGRSTPTIAAPRPVAASPLLSVQQDGAALRLRWNADSAAVRSAHEGALVVVDGKRESRMELGAKELRAGAATWWPESREVTFRLELDGAPAGSVQASATPLPHEPRPSAFEPPVRVRRKSAPIPRVAPVTTRVAVEETPKRGSKIGRVVGKIPLLKRLRRNRD